MNCRPWLAAVVFLVLAHDGRCADNPSRQEVIEALRKATRFMHGTIADHGGYAWTAGVDGKLRNGEGAAGPGTIWVQPPGTPAVGLAFLDCYEATGDEVYLKAAEDAATALIKGQLRSGGWNYRIDFDPAKRKELVYRDGEKGGREHIPKTPAPGGWDVWKQRRYKDDMTILDDDTTPAALRLLLRVDRVLKSKSKAVHEAADYALTSTLNAQYPNGAWSHNYDRFPAEPPSEDHYPVKKASLPEKWSRTWTKDFTGCYALNDRITQNMIATMLLAYQVRGDKRYLASAERGGRFLIDAQLPDPQPAWAQQYDRSMQPVWDRKFEPPAITGLESQDTLETLLLLYRETGERKYLEPLETAIPYLKKSVLADGSIARFYELKTNRPLYFTKEYRLTHDKDDVPTHYAFVVKSRLDAIDAEYQRLLKAKTADARAVPARPVTKELTESVRKILAAQDAKGAWTGPGTVRDAQGRKTTPKEGVVQSATFIANVTALCQYVQATR